MTWRVAKSLLTLRDQIDAAFPNRSKASDGTIGDANHRNRNSDHNPWYGPGIVTAIDITHDPANGVDIDRLTDELAASRDPRIKYIIANGLILDSRPQYNPWRWVKYNGPNPHTRHFHLSVMPNPSCDDPRPWNLPSLKPNPSGGGSSPATDYEKLYREQNPEVVQMDLIVGRHSRYVQVPKGAKRVCIACPRDKMSARIQWHGSGYPSTKGQFPDPDLNNRDAKFVAKDSVHMDIHAMRPWYVNIPKGARGFRVNWTYTPRGDRDSYVAYLGFEF